MNIQQISFKNNFNKPEQKPSLAQTTVKMPYDQFESINKKDETKKYVLAGVGAIALIIAIVKHKQIGEFFSKLFKKEEKIISNTEAPIPPRQKPPVIEEFPVDKPTPKPQPPVDTSSSKPTQKPSPRKNKNQPNAGPSEHTTKTTRIIPKFKCKHPVGSKEYFDERLNFLHKTGFEIAEKADKEGFIKFLDTFDEQQKIAKSTNKGAFTEFGDLNAVFSLFKEGQRSDKLLSRFLDTYHKHIEDFDFKLLKPGIVSSSDSGYLDGLYREYGEVSSKNTIMKLLKEFERTGKHDYVEVKGIGEPFAMEYYFKHFTKKEQKEITAEANRVSEILKDRARQISKIEEN